MRRQMDGIQVYLATWGYILKDWQEQVFESGVIPIDDLKKFY